MEEFRRNLGVRKKSIAFLFLANCLLLVISWITAVKAYSRLPDRIPPWINFLGQDVLLSPKSPAFFIYVIAQTLFFIGCLWLARRYNPKTKPVHEKSVNGSSEIRKAWFELQKEFVFLALIFFNLIFIHLQTRLILLSHQISRGINRFYFFVIIAVLLMLIPYYRFRAHLLAKR